MPGRIRPNRAWFAAWAMSLTLMALAFVGCQKSDSGGGSSSSSGGNKSAADVIKVGHFASMTGSEATFGQSTDKGVRLALDEFNAAGGLKGKKVEIITLDTEGKTQVAGNVVTRLITGEKVVALLGEVASGLSIAGGRVAQEYGVPMITPASTNPDVTGIGNMIHRICFIDPFQGRAAAQFAANSLGAKKVAVLFDQKLPYSVGLRDAFEKAFTSQGGEIVSMQSYSTGDLDFSAQLTTIREAAPDALFIPGYYNDVGNIALQVRKAGITVPMIGGDGWESTKLFEIAGDALEGCFYTNHYFPEDPRPELQKFVSAYKAKYSGETPDAMAALGYDAAKLLFDAMGRAKSLDAEALAAAIAATKDFPGVTGSITLNDKRDAVKPAVILEIKGRTPTFRATVAPE